MSDFDDIGPGAAGNNNKNNTQFLNYLENGRDDSRNAYYLARIEEVTWLAKKRMWVVNVVVLASNNPDVVEGSTRGFSFQMGTDEWRIQAFNQCVTNFILAASDVDPDDKEDVDNFDGMLREAYPNEVTKRWTRVTEDACGEDQPLKGEEIWIECFRSKRGKDKRTELAKMREERGEELKDEDVWSLFTKYNFKPKKSDDWKAMVGL